jgi:hypothetical protein
MNIYETSDMLTATLVRAEHNLRVSNVDFAGVVIGLKKRWKEFYLI